jgi:predicted TPR repeat methyltransferase
MLFVVDQVFNAEFVDGVPEQQNLVASRNVLLKDGVLEDLFFVVSGKVQDGVLVVLHAADVLIKRGHFRFVFSGVKPKK